MSVTPRLSVPSGGGTLHWLGMRDGTAMGLKISVSEGARCEVRLYNDNRQGDTPDGDLIGRVEFTVGSTGAQGAL